jgi:hypothetical protein
LHLSSLVLWLGACAAGEPAEPAPKGSGGSGGSGGSAPATLSAPPDAGPDGDVCGDNVCGASETCLACPTDCGQCPTCSAAPSCSEALALPSQPQMLSLDELSAPIGSADAGVPDGGFLPAGDCGGALLRMRVSRIEVDHQGHEVWLPTGTLDGPAQSYYCLMQASDGVVVPSPDAGADATVEVALTRPTARISDHSGADFGPTDSIFWGQTGPRLTQNNLTITYSCFQQAAPGSNSWSAVLSAAGMAAGSLAGAGPYGWAFGVGDVALQTVSAAVDASQQQGDWHMFDVTQTIDRSWMLELTNGHIWSFTQSGGNSAFHDPWSVTLYVESWGCANPKPAAKP